MVGILLKVTADSGANLKKLKNLKSAGLVSFDLVKIENHVDKEDAIKPILIWDSSWAELEHSLDPGFNPPGDGEIHDAIKTIIGQTNYSDARILEAHIRSGNDVFITGNQGDFIHNGVREKLHKQFPGLSIMTIYELELHINKLLTVAKK